MAKKAFSYEKITVKQADSLHKLRNDLVDGMTLGEFGLRVNALLRGHTEDTIIRLDIDYYDECSDLSLYYERPETDLEQQRRIDRHERAELKKKNAPIKAEAARLRKIETLKKEAAKLGLSLTKAPLI